MGSSESRMEETGRYRQLLRICLEELYEEFKVGSNFFFFDYMADTRTIKRVTPYLSIHEYIRNTR